MNEDKTTTPAVVANCHASETTDERGPIPTPITEDGVVTKALLRRLLFRRILNEMLEEDAASIGAPSNGASGFPTTDESQ